VSNATFGLRTPQDLLSKLERELTRLKAAREPADMIDHGLSFAVSAWHMTDWIIEDDIYRDRVRARYQIQTTDKDKVVKKFQEKVALASADLESCRVVATCAKHLECTRPPPSDPKFEAQESPGRIRWLNNRNEEVTFGNDNGTVTFISNLCIVQGGCRRQASEIFTRTLEWWRSFIDTM
jgi:hypothetical protein